MCQIFHICSLDDGKPSFHIVNTFTYLKHLLWAICLSSSPPLFFQFGLQQPWLPVLPHGCCLHAAELWLHNLPVDTLLPFSYAWTPYSEPLTPSRCPPQSPACDTPCQAVLLPDVLLRSQALDTLGKTCLLCRHLPYPAWALTPGLGHPSSILLLTCVPFFTALPNGFRTK